MNIRQLKSDMWVETNVGQGQIERVGGTHPPSVRVRIVAPFPRGVVNVKPRDVHRELSPAEIAELTVRFKTGQRVTVRGDGPGGVTGKLPPIPDGEVVVVFEDFGEPHVNVMRDNGQLRVVARAALH